MKKLSKTETENLVQNFFENKRIDSVAVKKIKNMAMANRVRLKQYRKLFCKKCCVDLNLGRVRIKNSQKKVICGICGTTNRWSLKE